MTALPVTPLPSTVESNSSSPSPQLSPSRRISSALTSKTESLIQKIYQQKLEEMVKLRTDLIAAATKIDQRTSTLYSLNEWPSCEDLRKQLSQTDAEITPLILKAENLLKIEAPIQEEIYRIRASTSTGQIPEPIISSRPDEASKLSLAFIEQRSAEEASIVLGNQMIGILKNIDAQRNRLWFHSRRSLQQKYTQSLSGRVSDSILSSFGNRISRYITSGDPMPTSDGPPSADS